MKLTEHFTLAELTRSTKAVQLGLDNNPPPDVLRALQTTAEMLERIRNVLNVPVIVTSGYRSPRVNKAVGGVTSSDHLTGQAADIQAPRYGSPSLVASTLAPLVSTLGIGQLILEGVGSKQWVHVSTRRPDKVLNRVITITDAGARVGIQRLT